jgi:hypothetical protein
MRLTVDSEFCGPLDRRVCLKLGLVRYNGSTEVWTRVRMARNKVKLNLEEPEKAAITQKDARAVK